MGKRERTWWFEEAVGSGAIFSQDRDDLLFMDKRKKMKDKAGVKQQWTGASLGREGNETLLKQIPQKKY